MWKIRQISGIYDLHGVITIFYSMLQMEPALLRADELLQYAVRAGSGNGKGHCPWGTGGDTAWAVDEDWIREWRTDV